MVFSKTATFCYKCDEVYHPEDEGGIMWNDPDVGIELPEVGEVLLNDKDTKHPLLRDAKRGF